MALTKISRGLLDTGVSDSSDATAITIDSSERVGIGSTSPVAPLTINDKATVSFNSNDFSLGHHLYYDSTDDRWERLSAYAGSALYQTAGTMIFYRTSAGGATGDAVTPTESMRIDGSGRIFVGKTAVNQTTTAGWEINNPAGCGRQDFSVSNNEFYIYNNFSASAASTMSFRWNNSQVGSIVISSSGVAFNATSDYRLKENVVTDWDATTRLKQLRPSRFNFISDADTTVDGFLAHEVSDIVPEAITGEKDATKTLSNVVLNSDNQIIGEDVSEDDWIAGKTGDDAIYPSDSTWEASHTVPVYQGIDQSKLVPLLVKTIQELEARITTLENA